MTHPDIAPLIEHDEPCPLCEGTGRRKNEPKSFRERISLPGIRLSPTNKETS